MGHRSWCRGRHGLVLEWGLELEFELEWGLESVMVLEVVLGWGLEVVLE
jgi:hypothetical protein